MRRAVLAVLAVAGLAAGVLVAMATTPRRTATDVEWVIQLFVIVAALLLVATRATGKR